MAMVNLKKDKSSVCQGLKYDVTGHRIKHISVELKHTFMFLSLLDWIIYAMIGFTLHTMYVHQRTIENSSMVLSLLSQITINVTGVAYIDVRSYQVRKLQCYRILYQHGWKCWNHCHGMSMLYISPHIGEAVHMIRHISVQSKPHVRFCHDQIE